MRDLAMPCKLLTEHCTRPMVTASTVTTVSVKDEADYPWFPVRCWPSSFNSSHAG